MMLILSLFSIAQASPTNGFRSTICAGNSSNCPIVQLGFAYVNNRLGLDIGGFAPIPVGFNVGARYFITDENKNTRLFIGTSVGGCINGFFDIAGIGLNTGADFHLFNEGKIIFTPRIGIDYMDTTGLITSNEDPTVKPTFSIEVSHAY